MGQYSSTMAPESLPHVLRHSDRLELASKHATPLLVSVNTDNLAAGGVIRLTTSSGSDQVVGHELVYGTNNQAFADAFDVAVDKDSDRYVVVVKHKGRVKGDRDTESTINLQLFVPADAAIDAQHSLEIVAGAQDLKQDTHQLGRLRFFGGNIDIRTASGSQHLASILKARNVSLTAASGSVHLDEVSAIDRVKITTASGSQHIGSIVDAAEVKLVSASGGIGVQRVVARQLAEISTASGAIHTHELIKAPTVRLSSSSGSIRALPGKAAASGSSTVAFSRQLNISSASGAQQVSRVQIDNHHDDGSPLQQQAQANFSAASGGISIGALAAVHPTPFSVFVHTKSGSAQLKVAEPVAPFSFDIKSKRSSATLHTDKSWTPSELTDHSKVGQYGNRSDSVGSIRMEATSGSVELSF
ncbi:hypothetical protein RI367_007063 [Sorochytrium milnesiophthora]